MGPAMTTSSPAHNAAAVPSFSVLLGGISATRFFAEYWQKKPLLVRGAVPFLDRVLDQDGLLELACRDDAESRLVRPVRGNWQREIGPFEPERLTRLPKRNWSLLVSGVNMLVAEADALLNAFNFVPYARLDDLMVSFAPPGGGVGPHFDSYDVFLIQGQGHRRWEISGQDDLELVEDCPLRILKRFQAEQSWELGPGDLLYLPPKYAHNGVALTDCMTWSVGFRAPSAQEMATEFLVYLQDNLDMKGFYADPDLGPTRQPGRIPPLMEKRLKGMIQAIRWTDRDMSDFIGRHLSEPKPSVFFDPPHRPMAYGRFKKSASERGIALDPRSRMLYSGQAVFINGERIEAEHSHAAELRKLADRRVRPAAPITDELAAFLYAWYRAGYLRMAH